MVLSRGLGGVIYYAYTVNMVGVLLAMPGELHLHIFKSFNFDSVSLHTPRSINDLVHSR
jgi:hypothetical protein